MVVVASFIIIIIIIIIVFGLNGISIIVEIGSGVVVEHPASIFGPKLSWSAGLFETSTPTLFLIPQERN